MQNCISGAGNKSIIKQGLDHFIYTTSDKFSHRVDLYITTWSNNILHTLASPITLYNFTNCSLPYLLKLYCSTSNGC